MVRAMNTSANTILTRLSAELIKQYETEGFWGGDTIYSIARWHAQRAPDAFAVRDRVRQLTSSEHLDEKAALKKVARELGISKSEAYRELQRAK